MRKVKSRKIFVVKAQDRGVRPAFADKLPSDIADEMEVEAYLAKTRRQRRKESI